MEYTIQKLAKLAGISTRTLRYYDEIGLLRPSRISSSGYRIYGKNEVDMLQHILFYKEMGLELSKIKEAVLDPKFDRVSVLKTHLDRLEEKKRQIERLIQNVNKTIESEEGRIAMSDKEKFEGFKKEMIEKNESVYGAEIREKYGDGVVDASNAKMMNLTEEEYTKMQEIEKQLQELLEEAVRSGEYPEDAVGENAALLHKEWLGFTWNTYSPQAHRGLVQMYVADERFQKYYDRNVVGCAAFLKAAVEYHI